MAFVHADEVASGKQWPCSALYHGAACASQPLLVGFCCMLQYCCTWRMNTKIPAYVLLDPFILRAFLLRWLNHFLCSISSWYILLQKPNGKKDGPLSFSKLLRAESRPSDEGATGIDVLSFRNVPVGAEWVFPPAYFSKNHRNSTSFLDQMNYSMWNCSYALLCFHFSLSITPTGNDLCRCLLAGRRDHSNTNWVFEPRR